MAKDKGDKVSYTLHADKPDSEYDIKKWFETQSNIKHALLYLIEKEIHQNGNRDLSYLVPLRRNKEFFDSFIQSEMEIKKHLQPIVQANAVVTDIQLSEDQHTNENIVKNVVSTHAPVDLGHYADEE